MNRILIIEDDLTLAAGVSEYLKKEGYEVEIASKIQEARTRGFNFSLLILDWMLPDGQGIDLLREIRSGGHKVPVIFLTAKTELIDKVLGLESGANDYVTKPFELRELLARVRVHLRKDSPVTTSSVFQHIRIDHVSRQVFSEGRAIEMTKKEFDLLALLVSAPNKVFSREELLNKVWGFENFPTTRTVDTHVLQLRQKISDDFIETVRGIGYRLRTDKEFT